MADTKVSGLTAVAAALTTHEIPVNEAGTSKKVTIAQILALGAQGALSGGYAQITANQAGITTAVDITGLTVTVTVLAGRRIQLTCYMNLIDTNATDSIAVFLMEGATQLAVCGVNAPVNIGQSALGNVMCVLTPSAAAHTYKVQVSRTAGAGSVTVSASATNPAFLLAEDIGV